MSDSAVGITSKSFGCGRSQCGLLLPSQQTTLNGRLSYIGYWLLENGSAGWYVVQQETILRESSPQWYQKAKRAIKIKITGQHVVILEALPAEDNKSFKLLATVPVSKPCFETIMPIDWTFPSASKRTAIAMQTLFHNTINFYAAQKEHILG